MNSNLTTQIEKLVQVADQSFNAQSSGQFQQMDMMIHQVEKQAREQFQSDVMAQYGSVMHKLESGQQLTDEERAALELLIVGRAKYYLKEETDFTGWMNELKRLVSEIDRMRESGDQSLESLMKLQALCLDAGRVVADISFYLEEKERYDRFQEATRDIDPEESAILANMIRSLLGSGMM